MWLMRVVAQNRNEYRLKRSKSHLMKEEKDFSSKFADNEKFKYNGLVNDF